MTSQERLDFFLQIAAWEILHSFGDPRVYQAKIDALLAQGAKWSNS